MSQPDKSCSLCGGEEIREYFSEKDRVYWECLQCSLIFLDSDHHLDGEQEKARYQSHQNHPEDLEYRKFLMRLAAPLMEKIPSSSEGLDYGSGPGPTLSLIFQENGHRMGDYDPHFSPGREPFNRTYDFISCTETVEHFYRPGREFLKINQMLQPGAWFGVMTEMLEKRTDFSEWYYRRDPTHVCFYGRKTMDWISQWLGWEAEYPAKNITLFQKKVVTHE